MRPGASPGPFTIAFHLRSDQHNTRHSSTPLLRLPPLAEISLEPPFLDRLSARVRLASLVVSARPLPPIPRPTLATIPTTDFVRPSSIEPTQHITPPSQPKRIVPFLPFPPLQVRLLQGQPRERRLLELRLSLRERLLLLPARRPRDVEARRGLLMRERRGGREGVIGEEGGGLRRAGGVRLRTLGGLGVGDRGKARRAVDAVAGGASLLRRGASDGVIL